MESISVTEVTRHPALLGHKRLERPARPDPAAQSDTPRPAVDRPTEPPPGTRRVQALLADWGRTDSPYDLDGDGRVGVSDLLALLAKLSGGTKPPAADPGVESGGAPEAPVELPSPEALLADWGKKDSDNDLNGDGTVNVQDLLMLLAKMSDGSAPENPDPSPVQQLLADWGRTDSTHDLDGDGTVGVGDLLMLLQKLSAEAATDQSRVEALLAEMGPGQTDRKPAAAPGGDLPARPVNVRAAAEHLASALWQHAGGAGFEEIRRTLERSNLTDDQKKAVLDRIAAWAPRGLNLSLVG